MKFKDKSLKRFRDTNYLVSPYGDVINSKTGITRKIQEKSDGYRSVMLWKNGKYKTFYVHRIVAECFLPIDKERVLLTIKMGIKAIITYLI